MNLQNKVVVLTGGSAGIGYAVSEQLVAAGAKVYSMSRRVPEQPVAGVVYIQADLTVEAQVAAGAELVLEPVDILINNAGMMKRGKFFEISAEEFDQVWAVDVKGFWLMFKYFWKKLVPGAMTVQINSKNSLLLKADTFIYTLSKVADLAIDKIVAKERTDLVMKVAHFGPVDTVLEWTDYSAEQKAEKMKTALTPLQAAEWTMRLIEAEEKLLIYNDVQVQYFLK